MPILLVVLLLALALLCGFLVGRYDRQLSREWVKRSLLSKSQRIEETLRGLGCWVPVVERQFAALQSDILDLAP